MRSELRYFVYYALKGAFAGIIIGGCVVNLVASRNPYLMRKLYMTMHPHELVPLEFPKRFITAFFPQYAVIGGFMGAAVSYYSILFNKIIDANRFTKAVVVGGLSGATFGALFGPYFYWLPMTGLGVILGIFKEASHNASLLLARGDLGVQPVEYFDDVDEETKFRHKLEEARLMGYSGEQYRKDY